MKPPGTHVRRADASGARARIRRRPLGSLGESDCGVGAFALDCETR